MITKALRDWMSSVFTALKPAWVATVRSHPSKWQRFIELLKVLGSVVAYFFNLVVLKQLLVILVSEFLRMKRMVQKTIN